MAEKKFEFLNEIDMAEFISKRAHDLRSPYNHVIGFTKMVLNGQSGPLTDLQKEDLSTAYKSEMRTLWVVNNLIDIARLSRGEKDRNITDVKINQLLDQTILQWKKFNPDKQNVVASMVITSEPTLKIDETQTRQILTCFITYVLEFMQPDANVTITIDEEPEWWLMSVDATGKTKDLHSEMDLEMTGYMGSKFLELSGGEIRTAEAEEEKASIRFALPRL